MLSIWQFHAIVEHREWPLKTEPSEVRVGRYGAIRELNYFLIDELLQRRQDFRGFEGGHEVSQQYDRVS